MASPYPKQKTKTVCTIGPASRSRPVLKRMIRAGMNVARLNFSHGSLQERREDIESIRTVAAEVNREVSILADLPGPKIRIGTIEGGSCILKKGDRVILTTDQVTGSPSRITVLYPDLPDSVRPGSRIVLNDGFIQMRVKEVQGRDVHCTVIIGGTLLSGKGLNIPGAELTLPGVTD
ncbi:MAG: pyruvate kinase, partial [Desulfomonilia bacterium]|nr:pyruvate kinase [Desulfomonilia bacterium]